MTNFKIVANIHVFKKKLARDLAVANRSRVICAHKVQIGYTEMTFVVR